MSAHTPAPWQAIPDSTGEWGVRSQDRELDLTICEADNAEADARLIAAAPELLEALETVERWLCENTKASDRPAAMDRLVVAALAKARGGKS